MNVAQELALVIGRLLVQDLALMVSVVVSLGNTLPPLPTGGAQRVRSSGASVPQGSFGDNVAHHHQCVNE